VTSVLADYDLEVHGELRSDFARQNLEYFSRYFGYKNADFHSFWYKLLQPMNEPQHFSPLREHDLAMKRFHIEAPRKHGKSECIAINYPSWLIGNYPNIHITIVSKTASLTEATLSAIKRRVEHDPLYRHLFGDLKPQFPQKWNNEQIYVKRSEISKFPTIHATGLYGPLTGGGNDLIIADDVIDEENVVTRLQIEKALTWFRKVLLTTLFPWGAVLVIGTRWSYNDLYSSLLESWDCQVLKAIENEEEYAHDLPVKVLWPEVWPIERLEDKRGEIGTIFFNCQYQNDPTGMEGDLLKREWLNSYESLPSNLVMYAGVDPALGEGDLQGIATMGYDVNNRQAYLIDVWAKKLSFPEFLQKLREFHEHYKYSRMWIEANAFQKVLTFIPELQGLPTCPTQTVKDKPSRFIAMSSHYESKRVLVNPLLLLHGEFWVEWIQFPRGQYDDALDSAEIVTRNVMEYGREYDVGTVDVYKKDRERSSRTGWLYATH